VAFFINVTLKITQVISTYIYADGADIKNSTAKKLMVLMYRVKTIGTVLDTESNTKLMIMIPRNILN
jgi:hypothetical protein